MNCFLLYSSRKRFFFNILVILALVQFCHLTYRAIDYSFHYPVLIGMYCFRENPPLGYTEPSVINNELSIHRCSLENIDACQEISNQTILFRLNWHAGLASEWNNLIRAFVYAVHTRRRLLIDDQYWNYGSLGEFFNISQGRFSPWLPASSYCSERQFIHLINYPIDKNFVPKHLTIGRDVNKAFTTLDLFMKPLEGALDRSLEARRILAQYFWKTLNAETRDFMNGYMTSIFAENITFGIHIRRGDKLREEAKSISMEEYITGVEYFVKKGLKLFWKIDLCMGFVLLEGMISKPRVYVASDESDVINQLRNLKPDWEFIQFSDPSRPFNGHQQAAFNRLPASVKIQSTRILLTEMEILSRVKYLICTFSSNICRFIQTIRIQEPQTVLSLDQPWTPS